MSISPIDIHEESEAYNRSKVSVKELFKNLMIDLSLLQDFSDYEVSLKTFEEKNRFKWFKFWKELKLFIEFKNNKSCFNHIVTYKVKGNHLVFENSTIKGFFDKNWRIVSM